MNKYTAITIDPDGAQDLDDALWCRPNKSGWDVWVFVSTPSLSPIFPIGSRFDDFAQNLVVTRYGGKRRSLLPNTIEKQFSLTPYEYKPCLVVHFKVSRKGKITYPKVSLGVLESLQRFTYGEAESVLNGELINPFSEILFDLYKASQVLKGTRRGLEGWKEDVSLEGDSNAKQLVAELMIRANCIIAEYCQKNDIPVPLRVHLLRQEVKPGEPFAHLLNRAWYQVGKEKHVGLGVDLYCHATSPLRRYPDIILHRQLIAHLKGFPLPYKASEVQRICDRCNEVLNELADQTNEFFKERDLKRALDLLGRGHVHDLPKEQFSKLIKAAIASNLEIPNLHVLFTEIADRANNKQLDDKDRLRVLFQLPFPDLQRIVIENTELYTLNSYFTNTAHSVGLIEDSGIEMIELDQYFWCSAWVRLGAETYYGSWQGFNAKVWARRYAIVTWFREWIDNTLSIEPLPPPEASDKVLTTEAYQTPVALLNNHSQQNRCKKPVYEVRRFGKTPDEVFEVTCKYIGFLATGKGKNTKVAKQDAASKVLELMKNPNEGIA